MTKDEQLGRDVASFNGMQNWRNRGNHRLTAFQKEDLMKERNALEARGVQGLSKGLDSLLDVTDGGAVPLGSPGVDTVPAMLDSNEYVLPADTTAKVGLGTLDDLVSLTHDPGKVLKRKERFGQSQTNLMGLADGGVASAAEGRQRAADIVARMLAKNMRKKEAPMPAPMQAPEPQLAYPAAKKLFDQIKPYVPGLADGKMPEQQYKRTPPIQDTAKEDEYSYIRDMLIPVIGGEVADFFDVRGANPPKPQFIRPKTPMEVSSEVTTDQTPTEQSQIAGGPIGSPEPKGARPVRSPDGIAGYRYDVPEAQQDAFGKAMLSAMRKPGTFSVMPRDFYDGVDTRGMSDVEYQEWKGMRDRENALRQAAIGQARNAQNDVRQNGRPFGYKPALLYSDVQPGIAPSSQFNLLMEAERNKQKGNGLDALQSQVDLFSKMSTMQRAEEGAKNDREDRFVENAIESQAPTIETDFSWLLGGEKDFFKRAYAAGETDPRGAVNTLAGIVQTLKRSNEVFTNFDGKPITGAQAIAILNGEEPLDTFNWFSNPSEDWYAAARKAIINEIKQSALSQYSQ